MKLASQTPETLWYLFGSIANTATPRDIDLLIVYSTFDDCLILRQGLADICLALPLHLFLVSREEERELDFISAQRCTKIYPYAD